MTAVPTAYQQPMTGRYSSSSGARKGAALGIPPPADRVGGTHQSLGLDKEKALNAVYHTIGKPRYLYTNMHSYIGSEAS
jgi:hypothetical protein